MLRSEYQAEVLWIDTGIVAIPLVKIYVLSSSKCIMFGAKFSRMDMDNEIEARKVFGPSCLLMHEDFGCGKILQILVISDHIDRKSKAFEVMSSSF